MFGSCLICDHQLGLCNTKNIAQEDHGLEKAPKAFYECHNCFVILGFFYQTIALHLSRPISVSFLIHTSGKDSHSQAGSTKHIHISSRSLQLEQFYIRSVPHPCNWSNSTEFISTFSTSARLTWVQVRRQCTFRNFCKLAESGYHIFFIIWNKSLASLHNHCNNIDCTYNCNPLNDYQLYIREMFFSSSRTGIEGCKRGPRAPTNY